MDKIVKGDVTYYRLYCRCPKCTAAGSHVPKHYWKNRQNLGDIYIGDNACLYCPLDATIVHITKWEFCCPECSNMEDYFVRRRLRNRIEVNNISVVAGELLEEAGLEWFGKFIMNLRPIDE